MTWAEQGDSQPDATDNLTAVLVQALETPGSPYFLQVNCTDQKGIRALELFPGGAAVWNRRSQVNLPPSARSALLKRLLEQGFAGFEDSYGGRDMPTKPEAPARISCSIGIEIRGLQKSSVQMAGGEQSTPLLELAARLLDQAEQYADSAVTAVDLRDALEKLSAGQLAPQMLRLRLLDLPGGESTDAGALLHLAGGRLSRQSYVRGRALESPATRDLGQDDLTRLLAALQAAQFPGLPSNLWWEGQAELEVEVLGHRKVVLARQFSRLESSGQESARQRFAALLLVLREVSD